MTGQGIRFAVAGATVALLYLTVTTVLADVVGLPFQAALVLGFSASIATHFTLQRYFVWVHHEEFALSLRTQAARYLILAAAQYGLTAAATAILPGALHVDTELVYLATFVVITPTSFVLFRHRVFHPES